MAKHESPIQVTWPQALAWRMSRHALEPVGSASVTAVVEQLCGVQSQVASSAELAVRLRRTNSAPGEVGDALAAGRLIKTWAMRGTLHVLTPDAAGAFLALIADARPWDRPSWQRYFGMDSRTMDLLRDTVREALAGAVLTREELIAAVAAQPGVRHIADGLRSGWGTLLKPIAWQGHLCFGPSQGPRVTFTRPVDASPDWAGLPGIDVAAQRAIRAYFGAYGPATPKAFSMWLAGGWFARKRLHELFESVGELLTTVELDGERALVLAEDVDDLAAAQPTDAVRLLGAFDQWVLGPGTADPHVVPAARRRDVSRQSGWIAPVVVSGGAVAATWELDGDAVRIAWFREAGKPPRTPLKAEAERLGAIVGRELRLTIAIA